MKKVVIIFLFFCMFLTRVSAEKIDVEFFDCVDGDTIKVMLDGKKTTVRFLAVDTPETVHPNKGVEPYGKEASNYTCEKVKNAKKLQIEYDPDSDKFDKYERALGWIFVDGSLLQKELISKGYAKVDYLYGDYIYTEELKSTQIEAQNKKIGIWSEKKATIEDVTTITDEEKTTTVEETILEKIVDSIVETIKKVFKDLLKELKNVISKEIENIFN